MKKTFNIVIFMLLLTNCSTISYLSEQAGGQLDLIENRRGIKTVLKDSTVSKEIKDKLKLVLDVKKFLDEELLLKTKKNYSTYVDINRPWLVKVLTASEKCMIAPFYWSFPIVGKVPYLGFFNEKSAVKKELELKKKGYDTILRNVPAFSTLGWFSDPVVSSFLRYDKIFIISTIIHETVHANIFKKGDMTFNENIASFIEEEGTKLFLEKKEGEKSAAYLNYIKYLDEERVRIIFFNKVLKDFEDLYSKNLSCKEVELIRQEKFRFYENEFTQKFGFPVTINNAFLVNIKLYNVNKSFFQNEFKEKFNNDLKLFIETYKSKI